MQKIYKFINMWLNRKNCQQEAKNCFANHCCQFNYFIQLLNAMDQKRGLILNTSILCHLTKLEILNPNIIMPTFFPIKDFDLKELIPFFSTFCENIFNLLKCTFPPITSGDEMRGSINEQVKPPLNIHKSINIISLVVPDLGQRPHLRFAAVSQRKRNKKLVNSENFKK